MLSVQTNILAMNANRQLSITNRKTAKNTERLSSGYRINRSADDAAGLAISEKMRRQIRGLRQGSDNIQEGISLVQVADGALDEVVDILQRINELSIKAYNGTNTTEDREYIQGEITHSIKEIERIADTTTFNEIYVLKGNPLHLEKIEADKTYTGYTYEKITKDIPDWLKSNVDTKLESHPYYGLTQDTGGKMFIATQFDADGNATDGIYYGPNEGSPLLGIYHHAGIWNESLNDNPTAKISFSALAECDNATTLYSNLVNLLGSAIGVPCGTCIDKYYGIGFSGTVDGYSASPDNHIGADNNYVSIEGILDISEWKGFTSQNGESVNCFDKIKELMTLQQQDNTLTDDVKKSQTKNLAAQIAQKLCAKTYETMQNVTKYEEHFDRALTDGLYDIVVYDYRDKSKLSALNASDAPVSTSCTSNIQVPLSFLEPGTEALVKSPLYIVCSSQFNDKIPLELPLLNAETLGIKGYDVARYSETISYSDSYRKKLQAWENDYRIETVTTPAHEEEREVSRIVYNPYFDSNGELQMNPQEEKYWTKVTVPEQSYPIKKYNQPKPIPKEGDIIRTVTYSPDSNRTIKDALDYVLTCRTKLGAQQNRLEHAYNSNQNKHENTTASESRIRDTEMPSEMVAFSQNKILQQAGMSILSQANHNPEFILQLLQ